VTPPRRPSNGADADRVRLGAVDLLGRWIQGEKPASALVADLERRVERSRSPWTYGERRRLRELVFGTVRLKQRYTTMVEHRAGRPGRIRPRVWAALWVGLHEICELNTPSFAVVDQAVRIVRRRENEAASRFVNAVLRNVLREGPQRDFPSPHVDPVGYATTWLSHPRWLVERWAARMGTDEMLRLCRANNERSHLTLRVPGGRRAEVQQTFAGLGWKSRLLSHGPQALELQTRVPAPLVLHESPVPLVVQDEAAQLVAPLCLPTLEETWRAGAPRILDACAAPGGKTTHLAELFEDRATIVAMDVSSRRSRQLRETLARTGRRASVVIADGRRPPFAGPRFDAVLLDAPCTGTGVLARRHDARWRRRPEDLVELAKLQVRLLHFAVDVTRPGGIIVYSTCSLEPEENDAVVNAVLAARRDVVDTGAAGCVPPDLLGEGRLRTVPHRHGMDGAFAARLRKESSTP
jgi:16S rRNA (cytosine967-C5)-methyltransferase